MTPDLRYDYRAKDKRRATMINGMEKNKKHKKTNHQRLAFFPHSVAGKITRRNVYVWPRYGWNGPYGRSILYFLSRDVCLPALLPPSPLRRVTYIFIGVRVRHLPQTMLFLSTTRFPYNCAYPRYTNRFRQLVVDIL